LASRRELEDYTRRLAVAVTEALHYFIGHNSAAPYDETRYLAATGAHVAHMLRDAVQDAEAGYYNVPREVIGANGIGPRDLQSKAYWNWVKANVQKARACFRAGRDYLARVENLRCRIAGYAYIRRFEMVLDSIERESYRLRAEYPERKGYAPGAKMMGWALWMALSHRQTANILGTVPTR
jgi:phytoene/squalene synthetase